MIIEIPPAHDRSDGSIWVNHQNCDDLQQLAKNIAAKFAEYPFAKEENAERWIYDQVGFRIASAICLKATYDGLESNRVYSLIISFTNEAEFDASIRQGILDFLKAWIKNHPEVVLT